MSQLTIQQIFDLALQDHKAGRLVEAEQLYRRILAQERDHVDAIHFLGLIAHQSGRYDAAIELLRRAIDLKPGYAQAHYNLGIVLADVGRFDDAIAAYRQAIALHPNSAEAYGNLGNALRETGQIDDAIAAHRRSIALNPAAPQAHSNLGIALCDGGQFDEAIAACRKAIALGPNHAGAHVNLGVALKCMGQFDEALAACRQGIGLSPASSHAHTTLGVILKAMGRTAEAISAYRSAIALNPKSAAAHSNLGLALRDKGQLNEAAEACRVAVALRPDCDAYINLGLALRDQGLIGEAIDAYRQAVHLGPNDAKISSYIFYAANFHPDYDSHAIAEEHRQWNRRHAELLRNLAGVPATLLGRPNSNARASGRRLKIGYVSPYFRNHATSFFTYPLLAAHDHNQFEVYCYADVGNPDDMTVRLKGLADVWRPVRGMTDEQVAELIRRDQIDILIDLTMHMAECRPLLFARKPAPVQVAWLAYPGTTGLATMDYRLTDPYLDPPGLNDANYSETSIRLHDTALCYDPLETLPTPVNSLPALANGYV
ncbi:MAG TPA: tetratricopeptide repeat protein, partial [Humisphaera sp.]|nr:tetratricopeptide repeat protein [Humisphaera sp.]